MLLYEIKILRDDLLTGKTANTYDDAVKILRQQVACYKDLYDNPRIICDTDSKFELVEGNRHMCIWIEKTDSSNFFAAFERDLERFL